MAVLSLKGSLGARPEGGTITGTQFAPPGEGVISFEPMTAPANALVVGRELLRAPHHAAFTIAVA